MDQIMFQRQPVSYQPPKQETGTMSLSDRFTLIKLQKRDITNDKSKSNREKPQKYYKVGQGIENRSVFSRIGAVTPVSSTFYINHKNQNTEEIWDQGSINDDGNKRMKGNRTNHVDFNSKLFVIHEEDGTFSEVKVEFEGDNEGKEEVVAPNFQIDPATRIISRRA
ncbi:13702_t:CDS:2 [Funneliformis geosporum]|uniref:16594_t:CDS:1 n=1 Tax=Funneliformis geosporum TaxID=1117311 RepID=A0A9W4SCU8_9GLOM|nr:13702_t:CDS:2 [Funneliformis geosporum]CAI2163707.1 16594_t:CDS:2 [Funneliformis geosporum]